MARPRVVVTGAGGRIGQVVMQGLVGHYDMIGLDRRRHPRLGVRRADTRRLRRLTAMFSGATAVVDLAADPRLDAPWRSAYRNNILAARTVLEAARRAGVPRVVYASSNAVTAGYESDEPWASVLAGRTQGLDPDSLPRLTSHHPARPNGPYALSKIFGEAACRYYAEHHGLTTTCLRIGSVTPDDRPHTPRHYSTLLTHRDLVALVAAAIETTAVSHAVVYGVSDNTWRIWDIEDARALLGYSPGDNAERWRA